MLLLRTLTFQLYSYTPNLLPPGTCRSIVTLQLSWAVPSFPKAFPSIRCKLHCFPLSEGWVRRNIACSLMHFPDRLEYWKLGLLCPFQTEESNWGPGYCFLQTILYFNEEGEGQGWIKPSQNLFLLWMWLFLERAFSWWLYTFDYFAELL